MVGDLRFQLQVPHSEFGDYLRFYRRQYTPFVRQRKISAIGIAIGLIVGVLLGVTNALRDVRAYLYTDVSDPMVIAGSWLLLVILAIMAAGCALALLDRWATYRHVLRNMFGASRKVSDQWILLLGEDGFQTIQPGGVTATSWQAATALHREATASFLMMNNGLLGLVIPHKTFADENERDTCLTFIQEKIGVRSV